MACNWIEIVELPHIDAIRGISIILRRRPLHLIFAFQTSDKCETSI